MCATAMLQCVKKGAIVCNIGHFDNEIDTAYMRKNWRWEEVKPQVHQVFRSDAQDDYLLLLAEGRLVNLGNATGHPSRIMDGSFANQVLAQIEMYQRGFAKVPEADKANNIQIKYCQSASMKKWPVAWSKDLVVSSPSSTEDQAQYIGVSVEGPFKPDTYKY